MESTLNTATTFVPETQNDCVCPQYYDWSPFCDTCGDWGHEDGMDDCGDCANGTIYNHRCIVDRTPRSVAIATLADALGVSPSEAWESVKDHAGVYGREVYEDDTTRRAQQIAWAMWSNPAFIWTKASLARFVRDTTARYIVVAERAAIIAPHCQHEMCEQFHRKGCPAQYVSGWYIINRATRQRASQWQLSAAFDRRKDALAAFRLHMPGELIAY